MKGLSGNPGLI